MVIATISYQGLENQVQKILFGLYLEHFKSFIDDGYFDGGFFPYVSLCDS